MFAVPRRALDDAVVDEEYPDEVVRIGDAPNVPIAEMLVEMLRNNGVEAFYQLIPTGFYGSSSLMGPAGGPCDIYVHSSDAERARELLPSPGGEA